VLKTDTVINIRTTGDFCKIEKKIQQNEKRLHGIFMPPPFEE